MRTLIRALMLLAGLALLALAALFWLGAREPRDTAAPGPATGAPPDTQARIEQGRYLAALGNCMACHTAPGGTPYAGGRGIPTPFGEFFGPNLTPDPEYGIGQWSADDFWRALRHGKRPDGSLLYPAFPYTSYRHVSREDADALYAYLQSLPAARQPSAAHRLAFPYDQRPLIALWRALYFNPSAGMPPGDAAQQADPQWLRGRYLVQGLAHCAECHTARNRLGAMHEDARLQGGIIPAQNWYAPPLTGDLATGLGNWSEQDIAELLRSGISRHGFASGPMAESVHNGLQYASPEDARAMARYLKSLPAAGLDARPRGPAPLAGVMEQGARLYTQYCAQCHQDDGRGVAQAWPPLAGNLTVTAAEPVNAIRLVLSGGFAPSTALQPQPHGMPPFAHVLTDADIAAVVTYIRNSWGNQAGAVTLPQVRRVRNER
ncbi:cytochrome c [Orrella sp. JC864]|uniref:c-type cytochrome n=1 Tax=Orrella sp. JC864 TaxID=3120298 RepID=UPI0012BB50EE